MTNSVSEKTGFTQAVRIAESEKGATSEIMHMHMVRACVINEAFHQAAHTHAIVN